jgi:hypothetical protein
VPQPDQGALDELITERGDKKQQNQIERKSLEQGNGVLRLWHSKQLLPEI